MRKHSQYIANERCKVQNSSSAWYHINKEKSIYSWKIQEGYTSNFNCGYLWAVIMSDFGFFSLVLVFIFQAFSLSRHYFWTGKKKQYHITLIFFEAMIRKYYKETYQSINSGYDSGWGLSPLLYYPKILRHIVL